MTIMARQARVTGGTVPEGETWRARKCAGGLLIRRGLRRLSAMGPKSWLFLAVLLSLPAQSYASPISISVSPSSQNVAVGDSFFIDIIASGLIPIEAVGEILLIEAGAGAPSWHCCRGCGGHRHTGYSRPRFAGDDRSECAPSVHHSAARFRSGWHRSGRPDSGGADLSGRQARRIHRTLGHCEACQPHLAPEIGRPARG